jgi:hypothetical protein
VNPSRALIFFLLPALFLPANALLAVLTEGQTYSINFVDVDGNSLSIADGHTTVLVLTTKDQIAKAQTVGDRIPDFCLGNSVYRMVTLVNFQKKRLATTRMILRTLIRRRLDEEALRLQSRYQAHGIAHDARKDVFAAADFDGSVVSQLAIAFPEATFRVFVFGPKGELRRQWNDVPNAEELEAALKRN